MGGNPEADRRQRGAPKALPKAEESRNPKADPAPGRDRHPRKAGRSREADLAKGPPPGRAGRNREAGPPLGRAGRSREASLAKGPPLGRAERSREAGLAKGPPLGRAERSREAVPERDPRQRSE